MTFNGLSTTVKPEEVSGKYVTAVFVKITFLHLQYCLILVFALYIYLKIVSLLFSCNSGSTYCTMHMSLSLVNPEAHPEVLAKTWDPTGEYISTLQHNLPEL